MEILERQRTDFEKRVKSPILLILGIVLIALGIGLIASFVSYMQAHIDEAVIIENPTLADYLDTLVALLFLAGPLIIGGIIIAIFIVRKARAPKTRAKIESQYAQAKSAAQTAASEIRHNYESFANHQLVAFKYANPWLLDALARIVADGKANTLTQAIQYFENECYQQEMKGIANANLYTTQEVLEQTKSIQRQLRILEPQAPLAQLGHGANSNRGAHISIAQGHGENNRAKTHPFQFASRPPYDFFMTSVLHFGHTMRIVPLPRGIERIWPHPLQRKYFVVLRLTYMVSSMFHQRFGFADATSHFWFSFSRAAMFLE